MHLGLVGHQLDQCAPQPDRFCGEVAATAVALVEDQVDDGEHGGKPIREEMRRRHAERHARRLDLLLRPDEPLGHRLFGDEEGARDLLRGQSAECAERESDLGVEREGWMAAGEDELEALICDHDLIEVVFHGFGAIEEERLLGERAPAADPVDGTVARRGDEPGTRVRRYPLARPPLGRNRERVLGGFLGEVEVAEEADQRREHAAPFVAEDLLEDRQYSTTGRTSTAPPIRAAGTRAASSIAASRSSASKKK